MPLLKAALRRVLALSVYRNRQVVYVYGMRRSGNHACINWLLNALEADRVGWAELANHVKQSTSSKTVFINELNMLSAREYLKTLFFHYRVFRQAKQIILSCEDVAAAYGNDWRIPASATRIKIIRSTLNLLASRFQNLNKKAQLGYGHSRQSMGASFFHKLRSLQNDTDSMPWELDRWSVDSNWRREFLHQLDLTADLTPDISKEGGGSSFTGRGAIPTAAELTERFRNVEPQPAFRTFLGRAATEWGSLFTPDEQQKIAALLASESVAG